jgi:hypothetical protein
MLVPQVGLPDLSWFKVIAVIGSEKIIGGKNSATQRMSYMGLPRTGQSTHNVHRPH